MSNHVNLIISYTVFIDFLPDLLACDGCSQMQRKQYSCGKVAEQLAINVH